jgi:methionyl-tRNA formyltransferase
MIERMVRAFIPWPKAYTFWGERRLSILRSHICAAHGREHNPGEIVGMDRAEGILVQTGRGVLGVEEIQLEGKKALRWEEFLNGNRDFLQAHLGVHE